MSLNISKLKDKNTTIILHASDIKLSYNHIIYWLPALIELNMPFTILLRDKKNYYRLTSEYPDLQICYAKAPIDVEKVIKSHPNVKAILYPSNREKNIHLLRFIEPKHIFIGSKNFEQTFKLSKSYRAYDEIWVSGKYMLDKFENFFEDLGHLNIKIIGKPFFKHIIDKSKKKDVSPLKKVQISYEIKHNNPQSLSAIMNKLIPWLKKDYVLFLDREIQDEEIQCLITDIDSFLYNMFVYNVPILIFGTKELFIEKYDKYFAEGIYFFTSCEQCKDILSKIEIDDRLKSNRNDVLDYYIDIDSTLQNSFLKEIINV